MGANIGNRAATIATAVAMVDGSGLARVVAQAPLIETAPIGGPGGQGAFLNGAWIVASALGPHQLLHLLQGVESALGRVRTVRWGPRTIDLDLLMRDDGIVVDTSVLTLPHPRLRERAFVLVPLAAIAPDWRHPADGRTIRELAASVSGSEASRRGDAKQG